jgi:hypothetical protein
MASASYEEKRESKEAIAVWSAKVSFPAFKTIPAKTFYWGTSDFEVDGDSFKRKLIEVPKGRHQRDRGNDYAEFQASNPNNALYNEFYPYEDLIERAEVEIKECYEIELGLYESEIRFYGYLKDFTLTESDKALKFTAMSDLSRSGFLVGGRILTRERCGTEFNYNGLLSPLVSACGWQTIQGGNPVYCSKFLKGADGCAGLSDAEVEVVAGGTGTQGFPYQTGRSCFIAGTHVLMDGWKTKEIQKIEKGDMVLGFDVFTDKLKPSKVLNTIRHKNDQFEKAYLGRGNEVREFGVTREHLFYKGSAIFQAYGATIGETLSGLSIDGKRAEIASIDSETVYGDVSTYNIYTETGTYIICSPDWEVITKVHNLKPETAV